MGVSVKPVQGEELPEDMRAAGVKWAYRVTSWDGSLHYFPNGEQAAKQAFIFHREDQVRNGLPDDTLL